MTTLAEFVTQRLDEDEAAAKACPPPGYTVDMGGSRQYGQYVHTILRFAPEDGMPSTAGHGGRVAAHFARHDPARVIAEVAAKRRIVEECALYDREPPHPTLETPASAWHGSDLADDVLRLLALPFADHPDYDERWRP